MNYFKLNWHQINKAIESGQLSDLRKEQKEVEKKIQTKVDDYYKGKRLAEAAAKIKALKDAPEGTIIFYIGRGSVEIPFGSEGVKTFQYRKGRTRMTVEFNGKQWNCAFANLQLEPISEAQKSSYEVTQRLNKLFANH